MIKQFVVFALLCGIAFPTLARDKTDVIVLLNGDRITGEIKKLEHGRLQVSTDSMGTVRVEWDDIASVDSAYQFEFELTDGQRIYGSTQPGTESSTLVIADQEEPLLVSSGQVVRVTPIENTFWDRLDGSLSVGYSFTKASDVSQFNFDGSATYRTPKRSFTVSASTIVTSDQTDETTEREDIGFRVTRFRNNRWFNAWLGGLERNDELGLDVRVSLGGGVGRYLVQSNISELALVGGVIATRESLVGDQESEESLEGLIGLSYSRYIFDDPNVDVETQVQVYPNLTDSGRLRAQLDARVRYELVEDLFFNLSFYDSYDSDPASGAESTNDYGIVTSLGWSF